MTKQNKNGKNKAMLDEMVKSGSQIILLKEDGTEQAIEEIMETQTPIQGDPYADEFNYENWWNRYRASWLKSEIMTDDEIKTRVDDAWEVSDYKEVINLMAEMICRLQKQ